MAGNHVNGKYGPETLTPFEYRILELKVRGMSRNQIAKGLRRSPQTISNSLTLIKEKLGAASLVEAVWLALGNQGTASPTAALSLISTPEAAAGRIQGPA